MSLVLFFEIAESLIYFRLVLSTLLTGFVLLVVKTNQILSSNVEPVQVIYCVFGAEDVLEDDEASTFRLWSVALADLANLSIFAKDIVKLIRRNFVGQVPHEQYSIDFGWETCA